MKLYTTTILIAGSPITERNLASVAGMLLGWLCHVGWHLGRWPVTLDGESP